MVFFHGLLCGLWFFEVLVLISFVVFFVFLCSFEVFTMVFFIVFNFLLPNPRFSP